MAWFNKVTGICPADGWFAVYRVRNEDGTVQYAAERVMLWAFSEDEEDGGVIGVDATAPYDDLGCQPDFVRYLHKDRLDVWQDEKGVGIDLFW